MAHKDQLLLQKPKSRILLVESHVVVRQGLSLLINQEPDLCVCGGVSVTPAALEAIAQLKPDLVLTDITLKNGNGLEMIKVIAAQTSELPVLVLTMHDEGLY